MFDAAQWNVLHSAKERMIMTLSNVWYTVKRASDLYVKC